MKFYLIFILLYMFCSDGKGAECADSELADLKRSIEEKRQFYIIVSAIGEPTSKPHFPNGKIDADASWFHLYLERREVQTEILILDRNEPSCGFSDLLNIKWDPAMCVSFLLEKDALCENVQNVMQDANIRLAQGRKALDRLLEWRGDSYIERERVDRNRRCPARSNVHCPVVLR